MNSLFQQKQRELVLAVSKVEELTRQLEMLRSGRIDGHHDSQSAVAELDRLYKELQVRVEGWGAVWGAGVARSAWPQLLFLGGWGGWHCPRGPE